jgi:hypothetical protein
VHPAETPTLVAPYVRRMSITSNIYIFSIGQRRITIKNIHMKKLVQVILLAALMITALQAQKYDK